MTKKNITTILGIVIIATASFAQSNSKINTLFKRFQEGYTKRDTTLVNKFTNDLCANDIQIIGTANNEFFQGIEEARQLFKNDWAYWFNLIIDTTNISVTTFDNTALFLIRGTASMTFSSKENAYDFAMNLLNQNIGTRTSNKNRILAYASESANLIEQIESGSLEIKYAIRLSGGLIKQKDNWQFKQLVFSFPYPMNRK
jgi:hypothetical protein